jgi:hypothetical protein
LTRRQDSTSEISSFRSRDSAAQGISAIDINAGQARKLTRQDRSDGFLPVMPAAGMQPRLSRQKNAREPVLAPHRRTPANHVRGADCSLATAIIFRHRFFNRHCVVFTNALHPKVQDVETF